MRIQVHAWCWGGVLVAMAMLSACTRPVPEAALREQVAELQASIDGRQADEVEAMLAEDFIGNEGLDRREARRLAAGIFLRFRDVGVRIGPLGVEMHGDDRAQVDFTAVATGGSGGLLPQQGQVYEVGTAWRIVDGEWRMYSAQWKPQL